MPQITPLVFSKEELADKTKTYLQVVAEDWAYLRTEEDQDRSPVSLEHIYSLLEAVHTPPPTQPGEATSDLPAEARWRREHAGLPHSSEEAEPKKPLTLGEALREAPHMVLLGEAGAGKSTTLQYIGLCFARHIEGWLQERLKLDERRVPIRFPLFRMDADVPLIQALHAEVAQRLQCDLETADALIQAWSNEGQLLILMDGLDEVRDLPKVQQAIETFAFSPYGMSARLMVACRRASYSPFKGAFKAFTLKPLEKPEEAQQFMEKWLSAWGSEDAASTSVKMLTELRSQEGLKRLLDNPLILRLCVEIFLEKSSIARHRAELYEYYLETLCLRARRRGLTEEQTNRLMDVAEALAWMWHTGTPNERQMVLASLVKMKRAENIHAAQQIVEELRAKMGLLLREGSSYVFSHQTMREYLVAKHLARAWSQHARRTCSFLRRRMHVSIWREPLSLLLEMLSEDETRRYWNCLLHARSPGERLLKRDLFLSAELITSSQKRKTLSPELLPALLQALKDEDSNVREAAAWALGGIADPQAVPALLQALKDEDSRVRGAAASALGRIADPQAVPALLQALKDEDSRVRGAAAQALGGIADPQAVPALLQALKDEDSRVRWAAASALESIADPQAVPALLQALKDEDSNVRRAAASALIKAMPRAIPPLIVEIETAIQNKRPREAKEKIIQLLQLCALQPSLLETDYFKVHEALIWFLALSLAQTGDAAFIVPLCAGTLDRNLPVRLLSRLMLHFALFRARRRGGETYRATLNRYEEWSACVSPWQDPLQPPPRPSWLPWVRRALFGFFALLLASVTIVMNALLKGAQEVLSEGFKEFLKTQPRVRLIGLSFSLALLITLMGWGIETILKKLRKEH